MPLMRRPRCCAPIGLYANDHADIAAAETAVHGARQLSFDINAWESRWPINTYSRRDAGKLSKAVRDRLVQAEAMTIQDYRGLLMERQAARGRAM